MRILAIDPGKMTGFTVLEAEDDGKSSPEMKISWQEETLDVRPVTIIFLMHLREIKPDLVVVEDYRIYANKANMHIGATLHTAKLIGMIEAVCALTIPPIRVILMQASKKGRWPKARLEAKFPQGASAPAPHGVDALKLALAYLEEPYAKDA